MPVQNKVTYQSTVDSLAADNSTGGISETDVRTLYKNLSDSISHVGPTQDLGEDPTAWDLGGFDQSEASCTNTTNLSIALSNATSKSVYYLRLLNITGNINLTITGAGLTPVNDINQTNTLPVTATNGDEVLITIKRLNSSIFFWQFNGAEGNRVVKQTATIAVTSAEMLAINTTPKTLVAAQGAGTIIVPQSMTVKHTYVSTTYSNILVEIQHDAEPANGLGDFRINGTATNWQLRPLLPNYGSGTTTSPVNKLLELTATSNPTTGDGTFEIVLEYSVITI